jgi:hypothetical protein
LLNTAQSKIHIVTYKSDKALFLVSPKIFKEYDVDQWAKTQKQFGRLKINLKTHTSENIWQVQTKTHIITRRTTTNQSRVFSFHFGRLNYYNFSVQSNGGTSLL